MMVHTCVYHVDADEVIPHDDLTSSRPRNSSILDKRENTRVPDFEQTDSFHINNKHSPQFLTFCF